ncbi:MAG: hypothetical protein OXL34_14145 [Gemmatimonadota bacterium]|nr:hypothetical protein [Gemmatimonadota bacterium]
MRIAVRDQSRASFLTRRPKRREPLYSDDPRLADYPPPYPDGWYRCNDVRIWEEKGFMAPPMLSRDDGPVMRLRGWYRQFCPELAEDQAFEER